MKNIIFIVDNFERSSFFKRFTKSLKEMNIDALYLTGCYQSFKYMKSMGFNVQHLGRKQKVKASINTFNVSESIESLTGNISKDHADSIVATYESNLKKIQLPKNATVIFWNGHQLISLVCQKFFRESYTNYRFKFLEISNLPEKLFCDDKGVNAASSIASTPYLLDSYPEVNEAKHEQWLIEYNESKSNPLGQAIGVKSLPLCKFLFDLISLMLGYKVLFDFKNIFRISWLKEKFSRRVDLGKLIGDEERFNSDSYIFFPMQVSSDTQILINGRGYDNDSAIQYCIDNYGEDYLIVIKPHPAEKNLNYFIKIYEKYSDKCIFTTNQTSELISTSSKTITINSTVGLEAMIQGKAVDVLGECLYKNFDHERLKKYIHSYLIDGVDYFGTDAICEREVSAVLGL